MSDSSRRLARGVRFRRDPDGSAMLLVPEGIVSLNETAAVILELVDGARGDDEIVALLAKRYDEPQATLARDAHALLTEFSLRRLITQ
jgi:pyrroloquinoline quinone biosynthesis protein D